MLELPSDGKISMLGPFRHGDLVAKYSSEIGVRTFFLAKGGIFLAANWSTSLPKPNKDVLVQFDPQGIPTELQLWPGNQECLAIEGKTRFDFSLANPGSWAEEGCIGVHTSGDLALTIKRSGTGGVFLQLNTGEMTTSEPPGFIWSRSWKLELVLEDGYARIPLGEHS
jgi:hypothetical protein